MSDPDASTPRVFLVRHGETEWTKNGRYTGITDLELTPEGIKQVTATGTKLVGPGKLVDPAQVARIWVSPRKRAQQTSHLLFGEACRLNSSIALKITLSEDIAEWNYGDYEGLKASEIRAQRKEKDLDQQREWDIWRDGCEGGEYKTFRYDGLQDISDEIRDIQAPFMKRKGEKSADVVLVAHGLILRALVKRWLGFALKDPLPMMLSPGAIGILSYKDQDVDKPAFLVGIALPSQE